LRFRCGAIRFPALFVADIKHMMKIFEIFQKNEWATLCVSISFGICSIYGALCQPFPTRTSVTANFLSTNPLLSENGTEFAFPLFKLKDANNG
jgi:hypothetical protein